MWFGKKFGILGFDLGCLVMVATFPGTTKYETVVEAAAPKPNEDVPQAVTSQIIIRILQFYNIPKSHLLITNIIKIN